MHECHTNACLAGINPIAVRLGKVGARDHFHTTAFPKGYRCVDGIPELGHIEPQKEAAGRALVAETTLQELVADIEFGSISLTYDGHMLLFGPNRCRCMLDDTWHLWCGEISHFCERFQEIAISGGEP